MSNIYLIGDFNSGKTTYIKKMISNNLKIGKPSIYINIGKASEHFSKNILDESLVVNSNSFTQISKIKEKPYNDLVIINFSVGNNTIFQKIKVKVLFEVMNHKTWENHQIFFNESYFLSNYDDLKHIQRREKTVYATIDKNFVDIDIDDDIVYFTPPLSRDYPIPKDIKTYLNNSVEDIVKYVEVIKTKRNYSFIDFRVANLKYPLLPQNEKIELLVGM